jgi:hypothetical protein
VPAPADGEVLITRQRQPGWIADRDRAPDEH